MDKIIDQFIVKLKKFMPKWLEIRTTQIFIVSMLMIFPFFFTDGMFHLYLDKRNCFLLFSMIFLCILFPAALIALYDWGNDMYAPKKPDMIFALILLSALMISTVFALNPRRTFFGMTSRTVSGLCFLCCIIIFFAIRRYGQVDKILLWTWIAGSSGIYLFGILCACSINVLHIQDGLTPEQLVKYLTPLSNTNFNTCYVCLMLPPIMVMYIICKEQLSLVLCGMNLYLGFLFTFFIKTDSAILAIILGFILLGYFALETDTWSRRYIHIAGIYLGAKVTIRILLHLFPDKLHPFHGLHLLLLENRLLVCEIVCYLAFFLIWTWKKDFLREKLAAARNPLVIIGASLACCCIVCVLFINIKASSLPTESFLNHFVLTDSTFTRRGYIWKRTVSVLKEESVGRKLFGNGQNSFKTLMRITRALPVGSKVYEDPHSEILQMATDMGLLGLIGYFGLLFASLIKGLHSWKKNNLHIITILTLSVYMIQALANEYSIYTLPLLCLFLGLVNTKKTL